MNSTDNIKEISLTKGQITLVDVENYELLNIIKWQAHKSKKTFYARGVITASDGNLKRVYMHRLILGLTDPKIKIDHRNRNGLHNYKSNLRIATYSQNNTNRVSSKNSSSEYLGVFWYKKIKKWRACITKDHKQKHLGYFKSEIDAARARDLAAKEIHGSFANLNFPENIQL